jgi:hypothetical protein
MIPNNSDIYKRLTQKQIQYIILNPSNYFALADEYVSLQKIFVKESFLEKAEIWFDMIISPLLTIVYNIFKKTLPDLFTMLSFHKCFQLWKDWTRMRELRIMIREWIQIVKSIGGPFIATNDAEYHMFVYADAMQRIHDSLSLVTKERAKRTK